MLTLPYYLDAGIASEMKVSQMSPFPNAITIVAAAE